MELHSPTCGEGFTSSWCVGGGGGNAVGKLVVFESVKSASRMNNAVVRRSVQSGAAGRECTTVY